MRIAIRRKCFILLNNIFQKNNDEKYEVNCLWISMYYNAHMSLFHELQSGYKTRIV